MIDYWKLRTIEDTLSYCREVANLYRESLNPKEKEGIASKMLSFSFGDHFDKWRKDYPIVDEIEALASDLEWSNSLDVDEDWEKLIGYINDLAMQVKKRS